MCGIVGYCGKRDAAGVLVDGLRKLEYRGYDSAGIAVFQDDKIKVVKAKGRLLDLEEKMKKTGIPAGNCGIGHTRWATHGEPSDVNSHPHGDSEITIVHNGIIENYQELKEKLLKKGYHFESETDTEVISRLLLYYYDGDPLTTIRKAVRALKGAYALGILFRDFPGQIYAIRRDSPLIVGLGEQENFIASDVPAILKYTRGYCLIDEDEIVILNQDQVTVLNADGEELCKERLTADWDVESAEKGGYPHFMLKEIFEQPEALRKTVSPRVRDGMPDLQCDTLTENMLRETRCIHIVACGTASYAGMIGECMIEKLARVPAEVTIASEFRYNDPILGKNDLVIVISQSGETADTLAALRLAKERGIHTLAIVNVVGSSIAREADSVIYTWAGPEIAVASTKAYTVQMGVLCLFALKLAAVREALPPEEVKRLTASLQSVPEKLEAILAQSDQCKYIASRFQNADHLFYIGRGIDYALSMEGSLKLKEISYIHSEAYAAGELKHGTISLITDHVPVVAVATQSNVFEKTLSNIREVTTRGAKVLLVVNESFPVPEGTADYVLRIPAIDEVLMPLQGVVPLQLFAYYTAVLRGCDVDKPRNLAKSVTVE